MPDWDQLVADQLLTVQQVMMLAQVSRWTVSRHVADGSLKATRIGRAIRFKPDEVRRWIDSREGM